MTSTGGETGPLSSTASSKTRNVRGLASVAIIMAWPARNVGVYEEGGRSPGASNTDAATRGVVRALNSASRLIRREAGTRGAVHGQEPHRHGRPGFSGAGWAERVVASVLPISGGTTTYRSRDCQFIICLDCLVNASIMHPQHRSGYHPANVRCGPEQDQLTNEESRLLTCTMCNEVLRNIY